MNTEIIKLTPREQQVYDILVERGSTNKQIGRFLRITESTVKLHMCRIFKKYAVRNRSQLILYSMKK